MAVTKEAFDQKLKELKDAYYNGFSLILIFNRKEEGGLSHEQA